MGNEREDMIEEKDGDRLSILEKIERGEISIEDAEVELAQALEEPEPPVAKIEIVEQTEEVVERTEEVAEQMEEVAEQMEEVAEQMEEVAEQMEVEKVEHIDIPTRRERKLALAEKFQSLNPQMMAGLKDSWQWPWPGENWQWMWQNFGYPVYISHSVEVTEESQLQVVLYQGDLFISGWDEPTLKINGAAFDVRTGQKDNVVRIASSTGQLQIWIPNNIASVEARVEPGDMWLRNISANVNVHCQSGDLGCERIRGNVKVQVNGGDARLMGIEGMIDADITSGNTDVRDISSNSVSLKSTEGNIWLSLDSVNSGQFRCESVKGDINLLTNGELACELLVEATDGGRISPVILPWQNLLERSENKLHGILAGGGASVNLIARGGKIYIQESWMNMFPIPSPS